MMVATTGSSAAAEYEEVLDRLSTLKFRRTRADPSKKGDSFDLIFDYLKMLNLADDVISRLNVVHVAGTKGKGSTCSFVESILWNCGFRTGLFTSPHLFDVRERFRLDSVKISKEKFVAYFWWCWNTLQEKTNEDMPMPHLFGFLTLLAFKIFSAEQVDVAILEVGLGGRLDETNAVRAPVVCGVSSLGYDHMEILGSTLEQIAGEKAGIFKEGVTAYTVPQPVEAMDVLEDKASQLGIPLIVVPPLDIGMLKGQQLGLAGEHQHLNAGLAVFLCRAWLEKTGHTGHMHLDDIVLLPDQFIRGLTTTTLSGRAQILPDPLKTQNNEGNFCGGLIYYLDGAHTPESMEACARWFSHATKEDDPKKKPLEEQTSNTKQILIFNCMPVRDPQRLLSRLISTCADHGIDFHKAIFAPNQSVFNKGVSHAMRLNDLQIDVSWQRTLRRVWEDLKCRDRGFDGNNNLDSCHKEREVSKLSDTRRQESCSVIPSLPSAIQLLRDIAQQNPSVNFQVLVTGSLYLIGDLLRLLET